MGDLREDCFVNSLAVFVGACPLCFWKQNRIKELEARQFVICEMNDWMNSDNGQSMMYLFNDILFMLGNKSLCL